MTDETMKDLVNEHDKAIKQLTISNIELSESIKTLVSSQTSINNQLQTISESLVKQLLISEKLDNMNEEIKSSFDVRDKSTLDVYGRIFERIGLLEQTQQSSTGCNSIKLLHKDIESITKSISNTEKLENINTKRIADLENHNASSFSPSTYKWAIALLITYCAMFGIYVVQSINSLTSANKESSSLLHRDIKDTAVIMKKVFH